jgi:HSP20 family protein
MPGIDKKNLNIQIENDRLRIYATREEEEQKGTYLLRERNLADYEKVFTIDETIDRDSIEAVMKDGVLEISLQFKKEVQPRRIQIKG